MYMLASVIADTLIAAESGAAPVKQLSCSHYHFEPLQITIWIGILGAVFLIIALVIQACEKRLRIAQATARDTLQQHAAPRTRHRYAAHRS